jgi:hypothetical protein
MFRGARLVDTTVGPLNIVKAAPPTLQLEEILDMKTLRRASLCVISVGAVAAPAAALAQTVQIEGAVSQGSISKLHSAVTPRSIRIPRVTEPAARHYSIIALQRGFEGGFYLGGFKSNCTGRISRTRVRCSVSWFQGDTVFSGHTEIWYLRRAQEIEWSDSYTITQLDTYCYQVQHRPLARCSHRYHVS